MTISLEDVTAAGITTMFDHAESATFNPASGDPISCMVFIDFDVELQPVGFDAQTWQQGTVIEALLSELGREPNRDETFTVHGKTYKVNAVLENDGLTVKVQVT